MSSFLWRTADTCVPLLQYKGTQVSAPRLLRSYACRLRCTIPLQSFCRCCFVPRCFFLSTDTDVGGSKQKRVLLSKTCYQTCTRMYRFDNRSKKPQMHYTCGKKDFCFNRCPGNYRCPYRP